ncbi:MAG: endolytic transglycosylase MltG [Rudaea sp.]
MAKQRKRGRGIAAFLLLLLVAAAGASVYLYTDYLRFADQALAPLTDSTSIDVPLGTAVPGVVRMLDGTGIHTGQPIYWRVLARQMEVAGKLKAGEYAIDPGISPRMLLMKMAAGDVIQHRFTIVEGWTFAQLRAALGAETGIKQTMASMDDVAVMRELGENDKPPEGWFLPETYSYVKGTTDIDVLRHAHASMQKQLDEHWPSRMPNAMLTTPYQALILASIVEKETAKPDERPQIAAVFLHRLQLGMKLQTDPTVIYGLGAAYDGKIHRRNLDTDTPFNTYTRAGLPPTPIAMPGAASINAVLHPAATDALYFVARGDGSHEFSPSLEAHNRAVSKYQLHQNQ